MSVHISLIGVIIALTACALVGLVVLKIIAVTVNALLGRSGSTSPSGSGSGVFGALLTGMGVAALAAVLLGGLWLSGRSINSPRRATVPVASSDISQRAREAAFEASGELREAMQKLEHARDEMRQAVHSDSYVQIGPGRRIEIRQQGPVPPTPEKAPPAPERDEDSQSSPSAGGSANAPPPSDAPDDADQPAAPPVDDGTADSRLLAEAPEAERSADQEPATEAPASDEPPSDAQRDDTQPASAQGVSESGHVVVFQLTEESMGHLLSGGGQKWLAEFRDKLPDDFHESYALIPLSATVGTTAPAAARPFAAADRIQSLLTIVASMLPDPLPAPDADSPSGVAVADASRSSASAAGGDASGADAAGAPKTAEFPGNLVPRKAPEWLTTRHPGQLVVESKFVPADEDGANELRHAVNDALIRHIREEYSISEFETQSRQSWERLIELRLSDAALQDCLIDTWNRFEVLETGDGPKSMRKTIALVAFPESVERAAVSEIRLATRRYRAGVLAVSLGSVWAALVAAAAGIRVGRRKSRLGRYLLAPVLLLSSLGLVGFGATVMTVTALGQKVDMPFDDIRYHYVIHPQPNSR